ncbi:MAG: DUF6602 domain-containing protein [Allosphingosinicella sp.]
MIRSIADMLRQLSQAEAAQLAASNIKHAPTIGSMYEGLTRDLLERAVPPELDLRVVTGFVIDGVGGSSGQIDCMLVQGDGTPVPYVTGCYQWHVANVLAVFEVKKRLFGGELADAYDQLFRVARVYDNWIQSATGEADFSLDASFRAYADVTGEIAPSSDAWLEMDRAKHLILHTIMRDQIAPIRVMLGYGGYTSEVSLRNGFLDFLEKNLNKLGFGPSLLPNLIVAGGSSLIKLSGHPYHIQLDSDGRWPIMASSHINPLNLLLELIWTRISYSHPIIPLFGEDLEIERLSNLLEAKPMPRPEQTGRWGWHYYSIEASADQLARPAIVPWEPVELSQAQFVIISQMGRGREIFIKDEELRDWIDLNDLDPDEFFRSLVETRLVAQEGDRLELTTRECATAILADGRIVAADDNSGRLSRWVARFMEKWHNREI